VIDEKEEVLSVPKLNRFGFSSIKTSEPKVTQFDDDDYERLEPKFKKFGFSKL
jgi:hypothetical protein